MKKIIFALAALVCSMSINAQVMEVTKNGEVVATYRGADYNVVFKEAPILGKTGTAKRTGDIDVNWVQLWEDGPRFAVYNVGVTDGKPESYGGYYNWGKSTNKATDGQYNQGTTSLTGDDDTATKLWGSNWRMPTKQEFSDMLSKCDKEWTSNYNSTNKAGLIVKGKDDYAENSVFLPAAGGCYNGDVSDQGGIGLYWSSTPNGSGYAYFLIFYSGYQDVLNDFRGLGCSVRAVLAE